MSDVRCPSCDYSYPVDRDLTEEALTRQHEILEDEHPYHGEEHNPYKCSSEEDFGRFLDRIGEIQRLMYEGAFDLESGLTEICARGAAIIWYATDRESGVHYDDGKIHELMVERIGTVYFESSMAGGDVNRYEKWSQHRQILTRYEKRFSYLLDSPFS